MWSSCTEHYKAVSNFLAPQTNTSPNAKAKHTQNNIHSTFSQWEIIIILHKKFFTRKKFLPFWWSLHLLVLHVKIFYSLSTFRVGIKRASPIYQRDVCNSLAWWPKSQFWFLGAQSMLLAWLGDVEFPQLKIRTCLQSAQKLGLPETTLSPAFPWQALAL